MFKGLNFIGSISIVVLGFAEWTLLLLYEILEKCRKLHKQFIKRRQFQVLKVQTPVKECKSTVVSSWRGRNGVLSFWGGFHFVDWEPCLCLRSLRDQTTSTNKDPSYSKWDSKGHSKSGVSCLDIVLNMHQRAEVLQQEMEDL